MPPRFLQRMQRQSDLLRDVFGERENDPPPYPFAPSRSGSAASSSHYRRSRDLSDYQNRFSQDSSYRQSQDSSVGRSQDSSSSSLHYRQSSRDSSSSVPFPPPPSYTPASTPTRESFDICALPRDGLVLVTGANSYQGLHIVDQLLQRGFRVRGTVRDAEKAVWSAKLFRDRYGAGRYTTAVIPDMAAKHAYDIAVRGCAGLVHVASVTAASSDPHEVITPSIAGALNALEAAAKEPGMRRLVYCSCASAAISHNRAVRNVIDKTSWSMLDFQDAWAPPPYEASSRLAVQASSKMQAEQAVWRWYWERRPAFTLNTVLADTLFGAPLAPRLEQRPPVSLLVLRSILDGEAMYIPSGHFVNVSDSACLHLAALLLPDVRNERVFAASIPWNRTSLTQLLVRLYPEKIAEMPSPEGESHAKDDPMDLTVFKDVERAEELLKRMGRLGWMDLEGSVKGSIEGFL